jgi:hypothetical protein
MVWTILGLISGFMKLATGLLSWAHDRQIIDGAQAEVTAKNLKEQANATHIAVQAREAVRADAAAGRVPDDDPFQRD